MPKSNQSAKRSSTRVVIDTNLFLRGLMKGTATRPLIDAWKQGRFTLLTSEALLTEIVTVLTRPKFRKYFSLPEVTELIELIIEQGELVEPSVNLDWCRDPKDNIFLEVAASGKAKFIVTGDNDLKGDEILKARMKSAYQIDIVSVPEFLLQLNRSRGCFPFG